MDAVGIAAIARDLGVTKGSFYWHFATRDELLEELLQVWESETDGLVEMALAPARPLDRVLRFFELVATRRGEVPDLEFFTWARRDKSVAARARAVEAKRVAFIRDQLHALGVEAQEAARRAEASYLSTLGWIERASRSREGGEGTNFREFTEFLFQWVFDGVEPRFVPKPPRLRNGTTAVKTHA